MRLETVTDQLRIAQKWGFGMAPPRPATQERRQAAAGTMLSFLENPAHVSAALPDAVSEIKGLYNRCHRQDQWDWFTVWMQLGRPPRKQCVTIAEALTRLRGAVVERHSDAVSAATRDLLGTGLMGQLRSFPDGRPVEADGVGWIYILSERENPRRLKIGYTNVSVEERVRAINSATGVLVPYGVRNVWAVSDARQIESELHQRLASYRIRADREFFELDHRDAARIVQSYLREKGSER